MQSDVDIDLERRLCKKHALLLDHCPYWFSVSDSELFKTRFLSSLLDYHNLDKLTLVENILAYQLYNLEKNKGFVREKWYELSLDMI